MMERERKERHFVERKREGEREREKAEEKGGTRFAVGHQKGAVARARCLEALLELRLRPRPLSSAACCLCSALRHGRREGGEGGEERSREGRREGG